ncbi:hypothetical protein CWE12_02295 [Aliidiomarina sedimenti]|uniref:DUF484 domain-containing protein n=1 Tax=Aliidiomarina sedimenti TaxID=1933879 RepID=A0ABY0C238_9GAMM|nr:hypothetical protein [Aliidiomarina sedimenti]RUO31848.1 hypothetical protein CWE12_02295 [Aliidiomarina sedimenti]
MPLAELRKLIERFKQQGDNTPIALNDIDARICAIQEIISMCTKEIRAFIFFDEHGESELFDVLADEHVSRQLSKALNHTSIKIVTNNTSELKKLSFVNRNLDDGTKKLFINPIPRKLKDEIIQDTLDNEFFLAAPGHLVFLGRYAIENNEKLAEVSSFLSLFDSGFYETLAQYFDTTVSRVTDGEFR